MWDIDFADFDYWADRFNDDDSQGAFYEPQKPLVNQKPKQNKNSSMSNVSDKPPVLFSRIKSEYEDGQTVMCISGTITSIFAPKKGDTYEYQNATMKDAEGTEMGISFSKNSQPTTAKGKKVTIRSVKHETHGWLGIKVEDQEYEKDGNQVKKRVLKITSTAEVTYADAGGGTNPNAGPGTASGPAYRPPQDDRHPELILADITSFHQRCYHYAGQAYTIGIEAGQVTSDAFQAFVSSIFIEGCRQGAQTNYQERALKPIPPKILPPPTPDKWKECMIPKGSMMGKTLADLSDEQLKAFYTAIMEGKTPNSPFGLCVQEGAKEKNLIPPPPDKSEDADLDPSGDDIPF